MMFDPARDAALIERARCVAILRRIEDCMEEGLPTHECVARLQQQAICRYAIQRIEEDTHD